MFDQITAAVDEAARELLTRAEVPGATFLRGAVYGGNIDPHLIAFFDLPDGRWGTISQHPGTYTVRVYAGRNGVQSEVHNPDLSAAVRAVFP